MDTVVFTVDERRSTLKLMFSKGRALEYREYPFEMDEWENIPDYVRIFSQTLPNFLEAEKPGLLKAVYVLPDKYMFYDCVETPVLFGKSQRETFKLELGSRYPRLASYKTVFRTVAREGGNITVSAIMTENEHIAEIVNAMKAYKFAARTVTFEAVTVANAFLNAEPKRGGTLYAAVGDFSTKVIAIKDRALLFFTEIPYGNDLLCLPRPLAESPGFLEPPEFVCKEGRNDGRNGKYLVRALFEMRDVLESRYHLRDLSLKYSVKREYADRLAGYKGMERVTRMPDRMELAGAFAPKTYNKGLLFK